MPRFRFPLAAVVAVLVSLVCVVSASAATLTPTTSPLPGSNFQGGDGNQANPSGDVSVPADGISDIDWQSISSTPGAIDTNATNGGDLAFAGGDKESEPGLWGFSNEGSGVNPSKDNLLGAWSTSAPNVTGAPNSYLYLAYTREANTGNTFNTFELNQLAQTWNNGHATITCRTTGDLIISYEVDSGSASNIGITIYRWVSTTTDAVTGCGKTGTLTPIDPQPNAEGAINTTNITNYLSTGTFGNTFLAGTWGEAALNLTAILTSANLNPCQNFGQISMHTRSSTSIDSQLQDYISPVPVLVRSCSLQIEKTGSTPKHDGDPETFNYDVTNDGSVPVTVSKVSNTGVTDDKCAPVTYVSGDTNSDGKVQTSETWKFTCAYTVKHSDENASQDIINTATVHGTVGTTPVTRSDTYTTHVIHPAIDVTKTVDKATAHVGDVLTYTVTVKNTGDTSLTVTPADTGCAPFSTTNFTLAAGASKVISCSHTAAAADGTSYDNKACATGVDSIGGVKGTVSDCDTATTKIIHPAIEVTKSATETAVHVGDTIHYTVTVKNTGDTSLTVTPSDVNCSAFDNSAFTLAAGASTQLSCTHVAATGDGTSYKNEACATGVDSIGGTDGTVSDCDTVTTKIYHPAIDVTKSATETAVHVGDTIHYTIDVKNTGDVDLAVTPSDTGCTAFDNTAFNLAVDATKTLTCTHIAATIDGSAYDNKACATGVDPISGEVSDCDTVTVKIYHPAIDVTKKVIEATAHVGDTLHYSVDVKNIGDIALNVTPSDAGCTALDNTPFPLAVDATKTLTCTHIVDSLDGPSYDNKACAEGVDDANGKVSDCDTVTTELIHPAIHVVKSGTPTTTHDGDKVVYSYDVTNTGDTPLSDIHVLDDKCSAVTYVSGDTNSDSKLQVGETWNYSCDYTVKHSDEAADHKITNTVNADGTDKLNKKVTDDDSFKILVVHPAIDVTKKAAEVSVHTGEVIHYTVNVHNTGDVALTISPSDLNCTGFDATPFNLAAGADKDLLCTHTADSGDGAAYKNKACADGLDTAGKTVSDCDEVTTEIIKPAIHVDKSASPTTAHDSDHVTYSYAVTNPGDTPLSNINVTDDKCSPVTAALVAGHNAGDTNSDDNLDVGETWAYTCDYTVKHSDENGSGDITNIVVADGTDKLGTKVTDDDTKTIHIVHPAIVVTKSGEAVVHLGDTINYKVNVHNTGDVALTISPSDLNCTGFDATPFNLAPGADKDLLCTHLTSGADNGSYENKACADGDDGAGVTVSDCDTVITEIIDPAIKVVKSGTPVTNHDGDAVTYSYDVTNEGNTPLSNVHALDDKCAAVTFVSGDTDNDGKLDVGETWKYTCAYTVKHADENGSHNVVNQIDVDGTDKLGKTVKDDDTFSIKVIHPAIDVTKKATESVVHVGETIHYTVTVENTGDTSLTVTPTDTKCDGFSGADFTLAAGASKDLTCTHVATSGDGNSYGNTACADGVDTLNGKVADCDEITTKIVHPGFDVTKTVDKARAHVGDTLTYTIKAINTGDTTLHVSNFDDHIKNTVIAGCDFAAGQAPPATFDLDPAGTVGGGDVRTFTCTHVVDGADPTPYTNVACFDATDGLGAAPATFSECDETTTEPLDAILTIEKKVDKATALDNETLSYTIVVKNVGKATATDVQVTDVIKGTNHGCENLTGPAQGGSLAPGASITYTCTYKVVHAEEDSNRDIVNTASATGKNPNGDPVGPVSSSVTTHILHPAIAIDKTGPATAQAGDKVGYTLTITNPGEVNFDEANVVVTDPICNGDPVTLLGKGGDASPGTFDPGDAWTYTCSVQTAIGDTAIHNVATVTGTHSPADPVSASDPADTTLAQPEQLVLPERITPGSAKLSGRSGCVAKAFNARIRGTKLATVVFVLDGKVKKRFKAKANTKLVQLRINPKKMKIGVHRLVVNITFAAGSGTKAKTIRLSFQRCAKKLAAPHFTG